MEIRKLNGVENDEDAKRFIKLLILLMLFIFFIILLFAPEPESQKNKISDIEEIHLLSEKGNVLKTCYCSEIENATDDSWLKNILSNIN